MTPLSPSMPVCNQAPSSDGFYKTTLTNVFNSPARIPNTNVTKITWLQDIFKESAVLCSVVLSPCRIRTVKRAHFTVSLPQPLTWLDDCFFFVFFSCLKLWDSTTNFWVVTRSAHREVAFNYYLWSLIRRVINHLRVEHILWMQSSLVTRQSAQPHLHVMSQDLDQ